MCNLRNVYLYCWVKKHTILKREYEIIENVEEGDIIRMEVDSILTDKQGDSIMVKSVQPEYMLDSIL